MDDFRKRLTEALTDLFPQIATNEKQIKQIVEKASQLRTHLNQSQTYDLNLTVDLTEKHLAKRAMRDPKWAWNNWVGSLEFVEAVPSGYQI